MIFWGVFSINQISKIIANDSKSLEVLKEIIITIEKDLTIPQQHSFFNSVEFVQHQSQIKAIVDEFVGGIASLEAISYGFNRS